jgi:hypothetical protein
MLRETEITIEQGRDAGKKFKITEMPATKMDRWTVKAMCALGKSEGASLVKFASMDMGEVFKAFLNSDPEQTQPLLDELLACCSYQKDGTSIQLKGNIVDSIVEDFQTLFKLRMETLKLCLGFFDEGDGSKAD